MRRQGAGLALLAPGIIMTLAPGCSVHGSREGCVQDNDCRGGEVCYEDQKCVPIEVAKQRGAQIGDECGPSNGRLVGCEYLCRMGFCDGPPQFDGAIRAVADGADGVVIEWRAARDQTPADALDYLVFVSPSPGVHDYDAPTLTVTGETSVRIDASVAQQRYYVVVRARDEHLQIDGNRNEVSAVPGCTEYATEVQAIFDDRCTSCHGPDRQDRGLRLDSYDILMTNARPRRRVLPCRSAESPLLQRLSIPEASDPWPEHADLSDEERAAIADWIDAGAAATCPPPEGVCVDVAAPTFEGIETATWAGPTSANLCWSTAADDSTAGAAIVYEVHEAAASGEQRFDLSPVVETAPGQTCATRSDLVIGETYCWVVRARDLAGNRDDNLIEQCLTVPGEWPIDCVDYEEYIQPIFDRHCTHCHAGPDARRELDLSSYDGLLGGSMAGGVIAACQSSDSLLFDKVSSDTPSRGVRMPADGPPYLRDAEVEAIRRFIEEGARATCADPDPC